LTSSEALGDLLFDKEMYWDAMYVQSRSYRKLKVVKCLAMLTKWSQIQELERHWTETPKEDVLEAIGECGDNYKEAYEKFCEDNPTNS
jgi:hypothetical protein